jgi:hypothetical protein
VILKARHIKRQLCRLNGAVVSQSDAATMLDVKERSVLP